MSVPEEMVSDENTVVVDDGPKSVGWHDHHGMELTHVREFEPRYAPPIPFRPTPGTYVVVNPTLPKPGRLLISAKKKP